MTSTNINSSIVTASTNDSVITTANFANFPLSYDMGRFNIISFCDNNTNYSIQFDDAVFISNVNSLKEEYPEIEEAYKMLKLLVKMRS